MARNSEKAQMTLNRLLASKQEEKRGPKQKRPYLATECYDLNEADKWRQQILREVGKKVMEIQNAGLGEHKIRDLNDEINKLIREKGHWERRIVELGGPDYSRSAPKTTDSQGRQVAEMSGRSGGYRYFGAAKQLPGVKELFEIEPVKASRRTRHQMHKLIDPDYYGFRDEDDGVLVAQEATAEKALREKVFQDWQEKEEERRAAMATTKAGQPGSAAHTQEQEETQFVAYVPLPDDQAIEALLVQKKKEDLMAKYASASLQREQEDAKSLLNKRS